MAKHVIRKDRTTTVEVSESDSKWMIGQNVKLTGEPGFQAIDLDGISVDVKGKIITDSHGILIYSIPDGESSDDTSVAIAKSGRIFAGEQGVFLQGDALTLDNAGIISSKQVFGVQIVGDGVEINNSGKILSSEDDAMVLNGTAGLHLTNSGVIASKADADAIAGIGSTTGLITNEKTGVIGVISLAEESGAISITNKGRIAADVGALSGGIVFGGDNDSLVNRGKIGGDIYFRDGDDTGDFRKGTTGDVIVMGGDGDDTFIIDDVSTKIYEFGGDGDDTIKTTASFTLGNLNSDRIETLWAIGKKNVDLAGNDQENTLLGNAKSNHLLGGGGDDLLNGEGGNDLMDGGTGEDHFAFGEDSGIDTIEGFDIGEDLILLNLVPGIKEFDDIEITMSDNDAFAIVNLGHGNRIRLAGIDADDLHSTDFSIIGEIDLP